MNELENHWGNRGPEILRLKLEISTVIINKNDSLTKEVLSVPVTTSLTLRIFL